jgi:hypothetical protein
MDLELLMHNELVAPQSMAQSVKKMRHLFNAPAPQDAQLGRGSEHGQMWGISSASSLSDLTVRSEGKTGLRQLLRSFEANSHSIQRERAQKMTKSGFSAVGQR